MYIDLVKILKVPVVIVGLIIVGFGVFKFITALNINQQIASSLVGIFGIQFMWCFLWVTKKDK